MLNDIITEEILLNSGFEYNKKETELCKDTYLKYYGINDYKAFYKWTEDENPIKLDIDNRWNNSNRKWSLHIDNSDCETIGYADIDTIEQFNKLMEIFDSKLRL